VQDNGDFRRNDYDYFFSLIISAPCKGLSLCKQFFYKVENCRKKIIMEISKPIFNKLKTLHLGRLNNYHRWELHIINRAASVHEHASFGKFGFM
jgi:hypothetical protein